MGFKVFFGCYQNVCGGIEPQELRRPLLGQVIWNDKERFLTQTQPFCLHCSSYHLKGFACAYFVCQQRIAAVQHMGNGAFLMFPQRDRRVHTTESDMGPVVFAGTGGVHFLVVFIYQSLPPFRVFPNPVPKSIPDGLLFLGGQSGFLCVQHSALLAVCVLHRVIDTDIPQV